MTFQMISYLRIYASALKSGQANLQPSPSLRAVFFFKYRMFQNAFEITLMKR